MLLLYFSFICLYSGLDTTEGVTDQELYYGKTIYDGWGRPVIQIPNVKSDGSGDTTFFSYEVGNPTLPVAANSAFSLNDQDFYGYYSVRRTRTDDTIVVAQYYDAFDRLRREITDEVRDADLALTPSSNLQTRYEYNVQGQLTMVINPSGDTTRYWYDNFGRIQYKYQPDMGTISYQYDRFGNVRFTQTQEQADSNRMSFHEYDDLHRLTVTGEARFWTSQNWASQNDIHLHRLTDSADGSMMHNTDSTLLTINKTLWRTPEATPTFWSLDSLGESWCIPPPNSALGLESIPSGPYLKHPAQDWPEVTALSTLANFEDISIHPENVRTAVQYDRLPKSVGAVWSHFPAAAQWNALAPHDSIRNIIGHECAVAYRQHGGEAFHYTVMSYDERGRVEAVIHYNENLGFDAVYYTYNSMNMVTEVRTTDPQRQHTSWYSYDHNGRVDSVWTKLGSVGTGLGLTNPHFPSDLSRPAAADILYGYTKRDQIDTMNYPAIDVGIKYFYDALKLLTIMKANKSGNNLFREFLRYDKVGDILWQQSTQGSDPPITQDYIYDRARRLIQWNHALGLAPPATEEYLYDRVGNRRQKNLNSGIWASYAYAPVFTGPDRLMSVYEGAAIDRYDYTADGAMKKREHFITMGLSDILIKTENFSYSYNGLLRKYTSSTPSGAQWDWRYRYSASGEREQKRTYTVPTAIVPVPGDGVKGWEYYQLDGSGRQMAVHKGIDASNQCGDVGRWVYFYPVEYNCFAAGGTANITIRPYDQYNGTKEYAIVDHLGSARATIDENGNVLNTQDYAPFGGVISGTEPPRKGFIDKEKDKESGDFNFGVRQFDGVRFTSIDPWWEKYRDQSPYQYCHNNPLTEKDPTGKGEPGNKPEPDNIPEGPGPGGSGGGPPSIGPAIGAAANAMRQWGSNLMTWAEDKAGQVKEWAKANVDKAVAATKELFSKSKFSSDAIDDVIESSGRLANKGQITEGARAIAKKLGHATSEGFQSAFEGIKPTQANAEKLIQDIMSNPVRVAAGKETMEIYNAAGQGVRIEIGTHTFQTFVEVSKATR